MVMQRITEILSSLPTLVVVTLMLVVMKPGLGSIIIALMLTGWINMSRIVRAQVLKLKDQEFVLAARTLGVSNRDILFKEILPNSLGQIIITFMFSIPNAIFLEAFLAFVGLGVPTMDSARQSLWYSVICQYTGILKTTSQMQKTEQICWLLTIPRS